MRRALLAAAAVVLLAVPAHAENPVLDPEDDADVAASLAEASEVQGVCYGYLLEVSDGETGQYTGTYAVSNLGVGTRAELSPTCQQTVEVVASISYTSPFSEAEDSSSWFLDTTLTGLTIDDLEDQGLSAGDLLDDGASATTLLNAVLSLPRLASEKAGVPPVVLEPYPSPLPEGAAATGTPGSDWLRTNGTSLGLCVLLLLGGVGALVLSRSTARAEARRTRPAALYGPPTTPPLRSDR